MNSTETERIIYDSECPYFRDGRIATTEYFFPVDNFPEKFGEMLALGFRRYGSFMYRNVCRGCRSCIPVRIELTRFVPSRSQRRTLRKNAGVKTEAVRPPVLNEAKLELFEKYLRSKHGKEKEDTADVEDSLSRMYFGFRGAIEMDYYLEGRLVGAGIVDESTDALSSNYFYYDTDLPGNRLGVFSILSEIAFARHMGKRFLYLGFYIEQNRKMAYKKFFRPNQVFENGLWEDFMGRE